MPTLFKWPWQPKNNCVFKNIFNVPCTYWLPAGFNGERAKSQTFCVISCSNPRLIPKTWLYWISWFWTGHCLIVLYFQLKITSSTIWTVTISFLRKKAITRLFQKEKHRTHELWKVKLCCHSVFIFVFSFFKKCTQKLCKCFRIASYFYVTKIPFNIKSITIRNTS